MQPCIRMRGFAQCLCLGDVCIPAWIYGEEDFLGDRKWMALESQIWGLLAQVNQDLVNDFCDEYNDLVAEAVSLFFFFSNFSN